MIQLTSQETKHYRKLSPSDLKYNMNQAIAYSLIPTKEEGWDEVIYYGASWLDPTNIPQKPHYIYILVNPSIPGICKIGYTTTTVYDRTRQINAATGVITPWYPVFSYKCPSGLLLESEIHKHLEMLGVRINPNREGFVISSDDARQIIEKLGTKYSKAE
jgi:hypothetical protein